MFLHVCRLQDRSSALQSISASPNCPCLWAKGDCIYLYIKAVPQVLGWVSGSSTVLFYMHKMCTGWCSFCLSRCFLSPAEISEQFLVKAVCGNVKITGRYQRGWFKVQDQRSSWNGMFYAVATRLSSHVRLGLDELSHSCLPPLRFFWGSLLLLVWVFLHCLYFGKS